MKIFYWKIRGLLSPIVNLCEYLQVPYEVVFYTENEKWQEDKKKFLDGNFPLANLPYIED